MSIAEKETVRDMAAASLAAVRVFEKLGIDYCCGGDRPLDEASRGRGLDPAEVRRELDAALNARRDSDRDWNSAPVAELVEHIVSTHHEYLRRALPELEARLEKVYRVYNERYGPTLTGLPEVFGDLGAELDLHLRKEEMILFPAMVAYDEAARSGAPFPRTPFGSIANPIHMMESEHDSAGAALASIHKITGDFAIPDYACVTYRALMSGLAELEQDLHMHIHLENNVLFPRALRLEAAHR